MKTIVAISRKNLIWICGALAAFTVVQLAGAQSVAPRISSEVSSSETSQVKGSLNPMARTQFDAGRLPSNTRINGISIEFSRSAAQEADLKALIAAQQTPGSPLYHQWLTPDQFAARFGMAESDLNEVESWLQQQGFSIDSVARSKNMIRFSGTAGQVESAFATEMHTYKVNGAQHFAPSTALSLPAAIAPAVLSVRNLDDFRPTPHVVFVKSSRVRPSFTSSVSGSVFFAPGDIVTAYDIQPVYSGGYTGEGQSITLVGQSAVQVSDIENFQNAAGLTVKDPVQYLMPNTGSSTVFADGDETESDLDLEWSGAIATGAIINFVYTGSNTNYGAFDALQYAIDEKIGTIISSSYGLCEVGLGGVTLESSFEQATTQGQTIMAASGDDGSTDCYGTSGLSTTQQEALAVDYPASSPNVTGVGGTEISSTADNGDYLVAGDGYWAAESSSDIISSALKYIPEVAWNDDTPNCGVANCLGSGGGGVSSLFTKPTWQTGVPGIPTGTMRDVPDLALYASPGFPGYLFCSSDTTAWNIGQVASCNSGFRDSSTTFLTIAGGTSFSAPIFSGMLALINQKAGYTTGQGLINSTLYTLAANSGTYASAFHDITSGNNNCLAGSANCSGTAGFSAGTGYDQVTGLGSVDVSNLANAWPMNMGTTASLISTTTTVSASNAAPLVNTSDNFTITVGADTGTVTPTGTVAVTVDGGTPVTETLTSNGTYVYTTTFTAVGSHTILAAYAGDATFAPSSGSVTVNIAVVTSGTGTITLAATPATLTVSQGSTGSETLTVTPKSGYTGTVDLNFDTSNDNALQNLCFEFTNMNSAGSGTVAITSTAAASTQLQLDTNASDCASTEAIQSTGKLRFGTLHGTSTARNHRGGAVPFGVAFAGLLLAGFMGRGSRKLRGLAGLVVLATLGLTLSACSNSVSTTVPNPPKGTYTITVTGQDSATASITTTTTFSFVIQ